MTFRETLDLSDFVIGCMLTRLLRESLCICGRAMESSGSSVAMQLKPSSKTSSLRKAKSLTGVIVVSWLPSA